MRTAILGGVVYRTAQSFTNKELTIANKKGVIFANNQPAKYVSHFSISNNFHADSWSEIKESSRIIIHPKSMSLKKLQTFFSQCHRSLGKSCASTYYFYETLRGFIGKFFLAMGDPIRPKTILTQQSFVFPRDFLLEVKSQDGLTRYFTLIKPFKRRSIYLLLQINSDGDMFRVEPYPAR